MVGFLTSEIIRDMSNKRSDRRLPEEVRGFLGSIFFMPGTAVIMMLAIMLLPSVTRLYWVGVAAGAIGIVL
jgi:hypothetical protein